MSTVTAKRRSETVILTLAERYELFSESSKSMERSLFDTAPGTIVGLETNKIAYSCCNYWNYLFCILRFGFYALVFKHSDR